MYNPYSLEGKTILVTGASSGIGRATAIECSKLGAKVVLTARNEDRLKETRSLMEGEGHQYIICDLANEESLNTLVDCLPKLNGIVNNAGFTQMMPLQFIKSSVFNQIISTNAIAPAMLLQKVIKKKKLEKESSVVFTSSIDGLGYASPANSMYVASKGAISCFIKAAALDLAKKKIRVNAVCPGMVNTSILKNGSIDEVLLNEDKKNYPLGRYGEPKDIALAIIYLLSDASSWVTGTNLVIDGGLTVK